MSLLLLSTVLAAAEERVATIGLDEIERGLTGYGLSVFEGNEVERFDVEVLGLMRNLSPQVSYILARLEGNGLEESGVVGGMSGSPVYLGGRLAGAVAFSWPFSNEAIAGITPIAAMRDLEGLPEGRPAGSSVAASPLPGIAGLGLQQLAALELPQSLLEERLAALRPRFGAGALGSVQFNVVGFSDATRDLLQRTVGAVAPAGRAAADVELDLEPGGVVAGLLMDGDLSMTVTGTVTERHGDEILALGHSFMGLGPLRIPMATAEVVTVLSSVASSFKISNVGSVVGAFDQDRLAGLRGRVGLDAPTIPVRLVVGGVEERSYDLRLADLPPMTPSMLAISILEGVSAASYAGGTQGIDLEARFRLSGHEDLVLSQSFDGINATMDAAIYMLSLSGFLVHNPLEEIRLEGVDLEIVQWPEPRSARLVGAHAERTQIRPGDRVKLNLDFVAYRGATFRRSMEITTPSDLPRGRYYLFVGDGVSIDAARLAMEPAVPENIGEALDMLRSYHSRQDLGLLGVFGGRGLVVAGQVMPRLPGSVRSIWQAASSLSATPLSLAVAQQETERLERPLDGLVRIDLEVLRREPMSDPPGSNTPRADAAPAPVAPEERAAAAAPRAEEGR